MNVKAHDVAKQVLGKEAFFKNLAHSSVCFRSWTEVLDLCADEQRRQYYASMALFYILRSSCCSRGMPLQFFLPALADSVIVMPPAAAMRRVSSARPPAIGA